MLSKQPTLNSNGLSFRLIFWGGFISIMYSVIPNLKEQVAGQT